MMATTDGSMRADQFEDYVAPLWDYLAIRAQPEPSDAIFVFGGVDLAVPTQAANLYADGWATLAVISGAQGPLTAQFFSRPEAQLFAQVMTRLGVPESSIVIEQAATNTGENVRLGLAALEAINVVAKSLLVVAKPFLMRRCIATFQRERPDIRPTPCPPIGPILSFLDRPRPEFALRLVAELDRLAQYAEAGYIVPQVIPAEVRERAAAIRHVFGDGQVG